MHRRALILTLGVALALGLLTPLLSAQRTPTVKQYLSPAYPLDLVSARRTERIAWIAYDEGKRNVFTAVGPAFKPVRLTSFMEDDGTDLTNLEISDDGPGLDPAQSARIFDLFYTTKKGGTGLGLPIANRIVEEHGGQMAVASEPGRGATFAFFLPFDATRHFFPVRPLAVSPIGVDAFVAGPALAVLRSEILVVWLPLAALVAARELVRRRAGQRSAQ